MDQQAWNKRKVLSHIRILEANVESRRRNLATDPKSKHLKKLLAEEKKALADYKKANK